MLQACFLHRVDFSLRFPCRVMLAYVLRFFCCFAIRVIINKFELGSEGYSIYS